MSMGERSSTAPRNFPGEIGWPCLTLTFHLLATSSSCDALQAQFEGAIRLAAMPILPSPLTPGAVVPLVQMARATMARMGRSEVERIGRRAQVIVFCKRSLIDSDRVWVRTGTTASAVGFRNWDHAIRVRFSTFSTAQTMSSY